MGNLTLSTITIPSYTVLDLYGARLFQANATNLNLLINNDTSAGNTQIEIFGGIIDGNKANQTLDAVPYNTRNTINLTKCTNSSVHGCYIVNSNSSAIYFDKCTNISAIQNSIVSPRKIGVTAFGSTAGDGAYYWIQDNYINAVGENGVASIAETDLFIERNVIDTSTTVGINCNGIRIKIRDNYVKDATTQGIAIDPEGSYLGDHCEITGNFVDGAKTGGIGCNLAAGGDYLIVKNNKVKGGSVRTINYSTRHQVHPYS